MPDAIRWFKCKLKPPKNDDTTQKGHHTKKSMCCHTVSTFYVKTRRGKKFTKLCLLCHGLNQPGAVEPHTKRYIELVPNET